MKKSSYISLQKIAKTYADGFLAVTDINLDINKGEFVTLLGPSGCGKTTILKMIAGFDSPTEGRIVINGIDVKDLPPNKRATATVFQDYALFPNMNVLDNIMYGIKTMRVKKDAKDCPKELTQQLAKIKQESIKKSKVEIAQSTKTLEKLKKELVKEVDKYEKKEIWKNIKNMRWNQYQARVIELQEKKRNLLKNGMVILDKTISANSTKYDHLFHDLKKAYLSKIPLDKSVDKIKMRIQNIDFWISYWENYPMLQVDKFEKKYTTRKLTKTEINKTAMDAIKTVGLEGKEFKFPNELSGGMQQRVAVARAIVVEPEIILLDEPLSALDAKVRKEMQYELKRLHKELGLTFILVTHDQEEALSLSDKVVVMSRGKIRQIGTPMDVYEEPINHWIASFIGKGNFFKAKWAGKNKFAFEGKTILCDNPNLLPKLSKKDEEHEFVIRPEDIDIVNPNDGIILGRVESVAYHGLMYEIIVKSQNHTISINTTDKTVVGKNVGLRWNPEDVHFLMPTRNKEVL